MKDNANQEYLENMIFCLPCIFLNFLHYTLNSMINIKQLQ